MCRQIDAVKLSIDGCCHSICLIFAAKVNKPGKMQKDMD
jgi:hypothetical protein